MNLTIILPYADKNTNDFIAGEYKLNLLRTWIFPRFIAEILRDNTSPILALLGNSIWNLTSVPTFMILDPNAAIPLVPRLFACKNNRPSVLKGTFKLNVPFGGIFTTFQNPVDFWVFKVGLEKNCSADLKLFPPHFNSSWQYKESYDFNQNAYRIFLLDLNMP